MLRSLAMRNEEKDDEDGEDNDNEEFIRVGKPAEDGDLTDAILYLSRFNKDLLDNLTKSKQRSKRDNDQHFKVEQVDVQENVLSSKKPVQNIEKRRRFALSLATLSSKPAKKVYIVSQGAIPALIDMSTIVDNTIERCCATAFSFLSQEPKIRATMMEEGAFTAIVTLAQSSPSKLVKSDCFRAMCNLCVENGYEAKVLKEGIPLTIVPIIAQIIEVLDVSLKLLHNLTCITEKVNRIEELSDSLVQLYNHLHFNLEHEILLASALANLTAIRGNQLRLVEDGSYKIIEKLLKSNDVRLRIIASEALKNLTTEYRTRGKLIENNVIGTLLIISTDPEELVKTNCVKAFYNIAKDVMCREKIVNANAVQVIIKMSMQKFKNVEMGRTAARILRVLCGDRLIAHRLVADGIIKALMALLRTEDSIIYQYCAESICSLFQISNVLGRLVEQGAVGVLVSLSQTNTDEITGEWCSFALFHLVTNKICPSSILEHGVLPCIIKLCEYSTNRTIYFCSAALAYMSQLKTVDVSQAIPLLVDILRSSPEATSSSNCATALYHMVDVDENCYIMLEAGALPFIVSLISNAPSTSSNHDSSMEIIMKCAAILSRLSLHKNYYSQFTSGGVLNVLLELSTVDHLPTQRRVVIAISNLSQNEELRASILELNPIPYLISLASKRDENLRRGCASIVCNLAFEHGGEKAIAEAGIIPRLQTIAMITSDQINCKVVCVKALINLMADKTLHKLMVKEGVIWGFSTLGLLDDDELVNLCSAALCTLSVSFARDMLESSTTVKMITKLLGLSDIVLVRIGARILLHMLAQTMDKDEKFRLSSVESLVKVATVNDEEVNEICILCLCLASQSHACRESIVELGMLSHIDSPTLFTDSRVCYAYLTMFSNIATDPILRLKIVDDHTIERCRQICMAGEYEVDLAVTKALYCVTCATENIPRLADQNVLSIIQNICDADYAKDHQLLFHLIAVLYNMTTYSAVHAKLVSSGIIELFQILWDQCHADLKIITLICSSVCHLACGQVNTTRMVNDGCTTMLCFMTKCKQYEEYSNYSFPIELYVRCAASMRNLLCVVSNQKIMVDNGALECLINMAHEAEDGTITDSYAVRKKRNKTQRNKIEVLNTEQASIYSDCASALRSMTFNIEVREKLISTGALAVILGDLKKDMSGDEIAISYELLSELEAESWENGSRGRQKEGRAKPIAPAGLFTDLLAGVHSQEVTLNIDIRASELEKYPVKVDLDEPKIENEDPKAQTLDFGIDDLSSFEEPEDQNIQFPVVQYPKLECDVNPVALEILHRRDTTIPDHLLHESDDKHHLPSVMSNTSQSFDSSGDGVRALGVELPKISGKSTDKKSLIKREDPEKKFGLLVGLIKQARVNKSKKVTAVSIDDVVDEWRNLSRF